MNVYIKTFVRLIQVYCNKSLHQNSSDFVNFNWRDIV